MIGRNERIEEMEKIVVIGSSGAGKSTFARKLGAITDTDVLHLDRYFWQSGWKEYPRTERIAIQQQLMRERKRWIMEGSYISSSDNRLDAADTIIFLDLPHLLCFWRVIKRHMTTYRKQKRADLPEGCTDRLSLTALLKILFFPVCGRPLLLAKISARKQLPTLSKKVYILRSNREIELFLQRQSHERATGYAVTEQIPVPEFVFALSQQENERELYAL